MKDAEISDDALEDLNNGYLFYEAQEAGLGEYFAPWRYPRIVFGE